MVNSVSQFTRKSEQRRALLSEANRGILGWLDWVRRNLWTRSPHDAGAVRSDGSSDVGGYLVRR